MPVDRVRHGRQIRLPEIGEAGQERLVAARVTPSARGYAREIEAAYLAAAGVSVAQAADGETPGPATAPAALVELGVTDPAALEVAEGALRALVAIRGLLGVGASS